MPKLGHMNTGLDTVIEKYFILYNKALEECKQAYNLIS